MDELDKKRKKFNICRIKPFIGKFAIIAICFLLISTTAYGAVKIFNFDKKLSKLFGKNTEELATYGIGGSDVFETEETEDAIISVNQTIIDEKEIYISLDITGKTQPIYLTDIKVLNEDDIFGGIGFGFTLLEQNDNYTGYVLMTDINGEIQDDTNITITLYMDNNTTKDITFKVAKNDMRVKEIKTNAIVYNDGNIIATVTGIRLTPLHIIFDIEYNVDLNTLDEDTITKLGIEIYNDYFDRDTFVTFIDGSSYDIGLWYNNTDNMLNPYCLYSKYDPVVDVEQIKSVTINGIQIELNEM